MALSAKKTFDLLATLEDVILEAKAEHSYECQFELLFYLLARIGHVRDMVGKMDAALKMGGDGVNPFQEFYDLRSHVTHGPQMPFSIKDDIIQIPKIGGRNPDASEWDDDKAWEKMNPDTFVPLSTFCEDTVNEFFKLITSIHQKIYSAAKVKYQDCKLVEHEQPALPFRHIFDPVIKESTTATTSFSTFNISGKYWG